MVAALVTAFGIEVASAAVASSKLSRSAALTRAVQRVMRRASIPGVIVGVWQKGQPPYVRAFGVRDERTRQPMRTNLYMRIGSETKTFTVTAVLELVDQGKVGLDDTIDKYVAGVPDGNKITLRELAEMRSGLFNYSDDKAWGHKYLAHPRRGWTPAQVLPYSFKHPMVFAPGTRFNYSNTNTVLLGLVVEKVSHQSLARFISQHILKPERMTHTLFPAGAEFPSPHAHGYTEQTLTGKRADATNWNPSWGWAAGAMISKLGDLHLWARDAATGRLLTPATQRERLRFIAIPGAHGVGYGLGLLNSNGWIGHNGSLPGYQSLTIYLPSQQASVVVLVNSDTRTPQGDLSTLLGRAVTTVVTPTHVFSL